LDDPSSGLIAEAWVRLALTPEIGPRLAHRLLARFGSPEAVFEASEAELAGVEGMGEKRRRALRLPEPREDALAAIETADRVGARLITLANPHYPIALKDLACPPLVLYVRGRLLPEDRLAVAVVGPRQPSEYARIMTRSLVPPLCARGLTIVSGLAHGVDAEAHRAALDSGGRTLAVLAHGLDVPVYPAAQRRLLERIVNEDRGAALSIFRFGVTPEPGAFPQRNEVIAALAVGVLVVEAGEKSGALITAGHALELGRHVLACPGDATRPNARGANRLIAEGAALIQRSDDVLAALAEELRRLRVELGGGEGQTVETEDAAAAPPPAWVGAAGWSSDLLDTSIREALTEDHRTLDYLLEVGARAGYAQGAIIQKLLLLELSGLVRQLPGKVFCLSP